MTSEEAGRILEQTEEAVQRVIIGQAAPLRETLTTLVAGGHALIEGVPGTAKTLLVRVLARCFSCQFQRIQFTPDLMPADITGIGVPDADGSGFTFREGPVFTDFLLADEINRAPAKTQAALLEAMQERRVTADGTGHSLGDLFTVFATQNPVEFEGTYRLPEAELDRFLMKVTIDYPQPEDEERVLQLHRDGFDDGREETFNVEPVGDGETLRKLRAAVRSVTVEDNLVRYIREIVVTTRGAAALSMGSGPRGSIALLRAAQASALFDGREFAVPDDVKSAAPAVLRHRVILQPEYEMEGVTPDAVIREILGKVEIRPVKPHLIRLPRLSARACVWGAVAASLFLLDELMPGMGGAAWPAMATVAVLWVVDLLFARAGRLEVERILPRRFSLDRQATVILRFTNRGRGSIAFRATDDLSPAFEGDLSPTRYVLLRGDVVAVEFTVNPVRRGEHRLGSVHLRLEGPLGLAWMESSFQPEANTARVYPDWGLISTYEKLLLQGRTRTVGMRSIRDVGAGSEFENLRDFHPGDDPRHVDWKSSKRQSRLTFRNREPERQQNVMILIDTGRLMTSRWRRRERLEVSLQAAGMLSWVVTRSHDHVGIATFSSKVHDVLPPASGATAVGRIREVLLRTQSDLAEPDFRQAFAVTRTLLPKRSLVILVTDPVGTAMAGEIYNEFMAMGRRHLGCIVTMRDPGLWGRAQAPVRTEEDLALRAAAEAHIHERQQALLALRSLGVLIVDSLPHQLTPSVVNRYLALKSEQRL